MARPLEGIPTMLVVSRKRKEKIDNVNSSMNAKRATAGLGVSPSLETAVLHEEMPYRAAEWEARTAAKVKQDRGPLSAGLKTTAMGLGLLRLQLDAGLFDEMRATLCCVQNSFQLLRYGVEAGEM
jgi:hypothetical protein